MQIIYVASKGIRKSRSLVAVHMDSMGLLNHELEELRKVLKVYEILKDEQKERIFPGKTK